MAFRSKDLLITGITGGVILLVLTFVADGIAQIISPYNIFEIPGMRAISDPVMMLFFLYPFFLSFITAIIWTQIRGSFTGSDSEKSLRFGGCLILLVLLPSCWVIFTSMTYSAGFYISNILCGVIGYPIVAYVNVRFNHP